MESEQKILPMEWVTPEELEEEHPTISQKLTELRNRLRAKLSPLTLPRKGFPRPVVAKLSRLASYISTPAKPQTYFRFMDLPDELQLKIVAYAIAGTTRYCEIREPYIFTDYDLLNKRRNPLKLRTLSHRIELAEVNHKLRAMALEFYPQCFTITKGGESVLVPVRFNLNKDVLFIPQWMIKDAEIEFSNLSMIKFMIITYIDKHPNATTIHRLSTLPPNARVWYIHEGIHRMSMRYRFLSGKGPFWNEDLQVARNTRVALRNLSVSSGRRPIPQISNLRLTCRKHGAKNQTGWLYNKAKYYKHRVATSIVTGSEEYRDIKVACHETKGYITRHELFHENPFGH